MKLQKRNVFHQNRKPGKPGPRRASSQDCPGSGLLGRRDWVEPNRASAGIRAGMLITLAGITLGGGGHLGNLTLPGGPRAAFGQFDHYEPFVVVDLADLADPTSEDELYETAYGEAMDVNDELFACGWYNNGTYDRPFFLDPRDGGSVYHLTLYDGATTYLEGKALRLCESTNYYMPDIIVVGWVDDGTHGEEAAFWTYEDDEWTLHIIPNLGNGGSLAADIDAEGTTIVGYWDDSNTQRPFVYDFSTTSKWTFMEGAAWGVDSEGDYVAGTRYDLNDPIAIHHDFASSTTTNLTLSGYDQTYGVGVNNVGDVVGHAVDTQTPAFHAALWFYDYPNWDGYALADDNPDPVDSAVTAVSSLMDGAVDIVGTYWESGMSGLLPSGAFYVTLNNSGDYYSYSLDAVTSGQDQHDSFVFYPLRIRKEVIENSWTPETYTARGLNNIGTLAGSYKDGAPSTPSVRPCLYVANDVNNNGVPDIREICLNRLALLPDLDGNENWLLDRAELMRVGLHSPGDPDEPEGGLDPVQIVRVPVNIKAREESPPTEIQYEDFLDEIVDLTDNCNACLDFSQRVVGWGTGSLRSNEEQSEILVRVHSMFGDEQGWGKNEGLPPDATTRAEALEDIRTFAWRFGHCIDWLQWGNESFGGARGYKIRGDELETTGCSWVGSAMTIGEMIADQTIIDACVEEAGDLILAWQEEQMEAARIGSALAGRPLRMVSSGISSKSVDSAYDSDTITRTLVTNVADWCNRNRSYFDMHVHYQTVDHAQDAIEKLVDTYNGNGAPWDVPEGRISGEVGAMANFSNAWWDAQTPTEPWSNFEDYNRFFFDENEDPSRPWEDFVDAWMYDENPGQWDGNGPEFGTVFGAFNTAGFNAICYTALQYDPGSDGHPSPYLIEALRATNLLKTSYTEDTDAMTPLKALYESAGATYKISNFVPHNQACVATHTCPDCGG